MKRVGLLGPSVRSRRFRFENCAAPAYAPLHASRTVQVPFAQDVDWPLAPAVERAIMGALRDAVSVGMSVAELTERLAEVLRRFEIELPQEDMRAIVGAHVMGAA